MKGLKVIVVAVMLAYIIPTMLYASDNHKQLKSKNYDEEAEVEYVKENVVRVVLEEDMEGGYTWLWKEKGEGIVMVTRNEHLPNQNKEKNGTSGVHVWEITGAREGVCDIIFSYYKNFQNENDSPVKVRKFQIAIDKNRNIQKFRKKPVLPEIEITEDDILKITMEENPMTDYIWHCSIQNEKIASVIYDTVVPWKRQKDKGSTQEGNGVDTHMVYKRQ